MKIVNVVVISVMLFLSVGFASAAIFSDMNDIVTRNHVPPIEFIVTGSDNFYVCELRINNIPSGVGTISNNTLSNITCNRTLEVGFYNYYISTGDGGCYMSDCYTLQISSWYDGAGEAIGYLSNGFQHIKDSSASIFLWGIIFCAIVILLGIIGMFMKALRG